MDKMVESSPSQILKPDAADQNTPPLPTQQEPNLKPQNPIINGAPYRLMVPKAFKYPERYTSPTDKMMSPVSRGILARNRKSRKPLPPSVANQPKVLSLQLEELTAFPQIEKC